MLDLENEITEIALRNLKANTGITAHWASVQGTPGSETDVETSLTIDTKLITFKTEVKRELREYHMEKLLLQAKSNTPFMLIADKLYPSQKKQLRENGIAYLDTSGNIYLSKDDILVWIDGLKSSDTELTNRKTNRAFTKAGLKVVYTFLQFPEAVNFSYRKIASLAHVALGTINEAMYALKNEGYLIDIDKNRMILTNKKELLENWLIGYKNILKPSLLLGTYLFKTPESWHQIELPKIAQWGGEPAGEIETNYLNPEQWTIYTTGSKADLIKQLHLIPKPDGNLKIYKQFWTAPEIDSKITITPELITYTDLINTGDQRCIETAQIIYNNKLHHLFE